jgi:DNA adenine methylase
LEDAFFYLDPPYVGAEREHYDGYTQEDFDNLLGLLETIKGKFLLSHFRNKSLSEFVKKNGWHTVEIELICTMTNRGSHPRNKVEVLAANYPISVNLTGLKKQVVSGEEEVGRE